MDDPETIVLGLLFIFLVLVITRFDGNKANISSLEYKTYVQVNNERKKIGLPALELSSELSDIARKHSIDMVVKSFFSHKNKEGKTHVERIKDGGLTPTGLSSENLAKANIVKTINTASGNKNYRNLDELVSGIVRGWMNSSGHRKNMTDKHPTKTGVGVYVGLDGETYYFTQVFVGD